MDETFKKIHGWIVKGRGAAARDLLKKIVEKGVDRKHAATFAQLSWRAGLPELGLRALNPIVRPPPKSPTTATEKEKAEYAHCLVKLGALHEGRKLLDSLDADKLPVVNFYRMSSLVAEWNYQDSIPLLRKYLESTGLDEYNTLVAKVNLAAALVYERTTEKAGVILRDLLYTSSLRKYELVLGRALELSAENFIARREWQKARDFLNEAEKRLKETASLDAFFVRKFRVYVDFIESRGEKRALLALRSIRQEAIKLAHWETVRDCDRTEATVRKDHALAKHLYFGTPYTEYRANLVREFGDLNTDDLRAYDWSLKGKSAKSKCFDLASGTWEGSTEVLEPGALLHRLVLSLSSDFYRPFRLAALHASLYPDRFFNPVTSPPLVHDAISRLRKWAKDEKVPFLIEERKGFYRLRASSPMLVRVSSDEGVGRRYGHFVTSLKKLWPESEFSIADATRELGIPRRTALRVLQQAFEEGVLERSGKARGTKYAFKKTSRRAPAKVGTN